MSELEDRLFGTDAEEFNFLIAKYLQNGPFQEVGQVLIQNLEEKKALPKRLDWTGQEHDISFDELNDIYNHVEPDYLLKVSKNVGSILEEGNRANNVEGISSLLQSAGCGRLDCLRHPADSRTAKLDAGKLLYSRNPWYPQPVPPTVSAAITIPEWSQLNIARQIHGFLSQDLVYSKKYYKDFQLHKRILGHLAAVFNVRFDRTGRFIITGSDDRLLKLWSALDGRLLFTFRGHSSEIVYMDINDENTMLAAVATDKSIRIWCLQTGAQLCVHKETGAFSITNIKFSPSVRGNVRFLAASSMDGIVRLWKYDAVTLRFLPGETVINERVLDTPDAKICSMAFSSGGTFMATGSCDTFVRIYNLLADTGQDAEGKDLGPVKIYQKSLHFERVDSLEYAHVGDRVLSGSRDGFARVWTSRKEGWTSILLNSAQSISIPGSDKFDPRAYKRKVMMVGWSRNDQYAIISSDDDVVRVFDSFDGRLVFELNGHNDAVYVLECHPFDTNIYLTAGHDSKIILWSLIDGSKLAQFEQWVPGHGASPFVDARWSPDGLSFAVTDMFGSLNIYGAGRGTAYLSTPDEQFFHTDYRPVQRAGSGFVVDAQTNLAPNLMQPPFLVSSMGGPYPPEMQRLVPGRERNAENVPAEPLPALDPALEALNNPALVPDEDGQPPVLANAPLIGINYDHPKDPYNRVYIPAPMNPLLMNSLHRKRYELGVLEVERHRELTKGGRSPIGRDAPSMRPAPALTYFNPPRELEASLLNGDVVAEVPSAVVAQPPSGLVVGDFDDSGDETYEEGMGEQHTTDESEIDSEFAFSVHDGIPDGGRRLRTRGIAEGGADDAVQLPTRQSTRQRKRRLQSDSDDEYENQEDLDDILEEEDLEIDMVNRRDDGPSTSRGPPPRPARRTRSHDVNANTDLPALRKPKKEKRQENEQRKKKNSKNRRRGEKGERESRKIKQEENVENPERVVKEKRKKSETPKTNGHPQIKVEELEEPPTLTNAEIEAGMDAAPPKWLTEIQPRRSPYFPQPGDILQYFPQGHVKYNEAACNEYSQIVPAKVKKNKPWEQRNLEMGTVETVKVTSVIFEIVSTTNFSRLALLNVERLSEIVPENHKEFKIYLQDLEGQEDFLVLKQFVDAASEVEYKPNDRVKSLFQEDTSQKWFKGTVIETGVVNPEYPDSLFNSVRVRWDNETGNAESDEQCLSPWDLFHVEQEDQLPEATFVTEDELQQYRYKSDPSEWPSEEFEAFRTRVVPLFERAMEHSIASQFVLPVDFAANPQYPQVVPYPVDMRLITERLRNRFYRRVEALKYDIERLPANSVIFNQDFARITREAYIVRDVLIDIISDVNMITFTRNIYPKWMKYRDGLATQNALRGNLPKPSTSRQAPMSLGSAGSEENSRSDDQSETEYESDGEEVSDEEAEPLDHSAEEDSVPGSDEELEDEDYGASRQRVTRRRPAKVVDGLRHSDRPARHKQRPHYRDSDSPDSAAGSNRKRANKAARRHKERHEAETTSARFRPKKRKGASGRKKKRTGARPVMVQQHQAIEEKLSRSGRKITRPRPFFADGSEDPQSPADSLRSNTGSSSNDVRLSLMTTSRSGRQIKRIKRE